MGAPIQLFRSDLSGHLTVQDRNSANARGKVAWEKTRKGAVVKKRALASRTIGLTCESEVRYIGEKVNAWTK